MCIIIVKPKGKSVPENILRVAAQRNPDLCGVAILDGEQFHVQRGLTIEELLAVDVPVDTSAVYHFRFATHGRVNIHNSHPFPLFDETLTDSPKFYTDAALVHNGIIKGTGANKQFSDTFRTVEKINKHFDAEGAKEYLRVIAKHSTNKFAICSDGQIHLVGKFYQFDGLFFSKAWIQNHFYTEIDYSDFTSDPRQYRLDMSK